MLEKVVVDGNFYYFPMCDNCMRTIPIKEIVRLENTGKYFVIWVLRLVFKCRILERKVGDIILCPNCANQGLKCSHVKVFSDFNIEGAKKLIRKFKAGKIVNSE